MYSDVFSGNIGASQRVNGTSAGAPSVSTDADSQRKPLQKRRAADSALMTAVTQLQNLKRR